MNRTSLIAGVVFVALGVLFLLDELDAIQLRAVYVLPTVLIVAGVVILAGTLLAGRGRPSGSGPL